MHALTCTGVNVGVLAKQVMGRREKIRASTSDQIQLLSAATTTPTQIKETIYPSCLRWSRVLEATGRHTRHVTDLGACGVLDGSRLLLAVLELPPEAPGFTASTGLAFVKPFGERGGGEDCPQWRPPLALFLFSAAGLPSVSVLRWATQG